jgi:hypothetical protein
VRLVYFAGALIAMTVFPQAGGGEPASAMTIPFQEPVAVSTADFDRFVVEMGAASALWLKGDKARASDQMKRALETYAVENESRIPKGELTPIERDVLDIRDAARDPRNFDALDMHEGPTYLVAVLDPSVKVTLANQSTGVVALRRPRVGRPLTLYLNNDQSDQLTSVLGTPWPDPARDASVLWARFLPIKPRHAVVGWSIHAHPAIRQVKFLNAKRTRAEVVVQTSDFTWSVVFFEKSRGRWSITHSKERWIA